MGDNVVGVFWNKMFTISLFQTISFLRHIYVENVYTRSSNPFCPLLYSCLCVKWHVDNNWHKNFKKIDGLQTVKAYVYKVLRVLLEKADETEFEKLLNSFLCKLEEEPVMQNFNTYFISFFSKKVVGRMLLTSSYA